MPAPDGPAEVPVWVTVLPVVGFGLGSGEDPVCEVGETTGLSPAEQPPTSTAAAAAAAIEKNRRRAVVMARSGRSMSTRRILPHGPLQHPTNRDATDTESTRSGRRRRASRQNHRHVDGRGNVSTLPPHAAGEPGDVPRVESLPIDLGIPGLADPIQVGRGGSGAVYRARQPGLNRVVAVKVLSTVLDQAGRDRFDREAYAMGTVAGHPNIVQVFTTGTTETGRPYLVMPFVEGGSLADRLPGPVAVRRALRGATQRSAGDSTPRGGPAPRRQAVERAHLPVRRAALGRLRHRQGERRLRDVRGPDQRVHPVRGTGDPRGTPGDAGRGRVLAGGHRVLRDRRPAHRSPRAGTRPWCRCTCGSAAIRCRTCAVWGCRTPCAGCSSPPWPRTRPSGPSGRRCSAATCRRRSGSPGSRSPPWR